jgi:transketolase
MFSDLAKRCIKLSYRHKLTHVSSVLNCVDMIAEIYENRRPSEPFILGNGHAALALYVVLEKHLKCDAEEMIKKHGVHPSRDMEHGIWCSSGSLGQAETIAIGMALADRMRPVWLVTSDGACAEGSVMESARASLLYASNLHTFVIFNGFGAYGPIEIDALLKILPGHWRIHSPNFRDWPQWLRGLPGHYLTLTEAQYEELMA